MSGVFDDAFAWSAAGLDAWGAQCVLAIGAAAALTTWWFGRCVQLPDLGD